MNTSSEKLAGLIPDAAASIAVRRRKWRVLKDLIARYGIALGGISVIIAVLLIFFYLLYVVLPMFQPASMEQQAQYRLSSVQGETPLLLMLEEQAEIGSRFTDQGVIQYFDVRSGIDLHRFAIPMPGDATVSSIAEGALGTGVVALGLSNGQTVILRQLYDLSYPDDRRVITPRVEHPLGETPLTIDASGQSLHVLAVRNEEESVTIAAATSDDRVIVSSFEVAESMLGDVEVEQTTTELPSLAAKVTHLAISSDRRWLFASDAAGFVSLFDMRDPDDIALIGREAVTGGDERITAARMLLGGISLLIGTSEGRIEQWFPLRDEANNYSLVRVREFQKQDAAIIRILPEFQRKGFVTIDSSGELGIYHTTAQRTVLRERITDKPALQLAIAPRSDALLMLDAAGEFHFLEMHNKHPEVSWSALWQKVWYENYSKPEFIWQSSAANQDFEPKFSITPLAFGTLKAAFYAMIIAVPLAIMGAIFTAYFMHPRMRQMVKPTIEVMEALPTVILGFLAGLWLAPLMERNLPGVFALLLFIPIGILVAAYAWHRLPKTVRNSVPDGWQAAILIPVIVLIAWFSFGISGSLEDWFFKGDFRAWLTNDLGIGFDQRNSMVVGFAMGFAVIPTIFTITEDAIFGVPKHLTFGSLALGATPWQTLVRVVMPTASPGIFSAVMIGLGRAVGETMIVLMATGNTPIMDFNIFEGMRTLSANIAVEMPESEVNSTHYRILFLAGFVLFLFTFVLNTMAELVRQRLRKKYASL